MARIGSTGIPNPYRFFGTFAGLPFWGGGLTLLCAAPGIGKTSWMLRMLLEAASQRVPAALGCYYRTVCYGKLPPFYTLPREQDILDSALERLTNEPMQERKYSTRDKFGSREGGNA